VGEKAKRDAGSIAVADVPRGRRAERGGETCAGMISIKGQA
jgi:hypothetical protein